MQITTSGSDVNRNLQHEPAKTQTFKFKSKKECDKCMAGHQTQILKNSKKLGTEQQRKRKQKQDDSENEDNEHQVEKTLVLDTTCDVKKQYDMAWPVMAVSDNKASVDFPHPTSAAYTSFRWTASKDV